VGAKFVAANETVLVDVDPREVPQRGGPVALRECSVKFWEFMQERRQRLQIRWAEDARSQVV
jgi:hypothetical protein